MTTLEITIYQTYELTNWCSNNFSNKYRSRDRAATWISGAFNDTSNYDVNITKADATPDPPQEGPIGDSFSAQCLCTQDFTCDYNNLWDWWTDWLDSLDNCNNGPKAADANLLMTNYEDGGGLGNSAAAVAGVGPDVAELGSSYETFGYQTCHKRLNAAIHELGHCFIDWDNANCSHNDDDGDGRGHDSAVVLKDLERDDYAITPMGITGGNRCHNNCSDDSDLDTPVCFSKCDNDSDGNPDGWLFQFSDCSACGFVKK